MENRIETQKIHEDRTVTQFSPMLFWDINRDELNMDRHQSYIVGRVLDYGTWQDWLLIRQYYGLARIRDIAVNLRTLFPKSLSFIALMTHTSEEKFKCYEQIQSENQHWNY